MERKSRIDALGAILLITIMAALGLNQVAVKYVNEGISPILQVGLRSACAVPLIFCYMLIRGKPFDITKAILIPGIATGICFSIEFALLFEAIELTSVGRTTIFFYTMPFWVALGAHFLIPEEKLTGLKLIGLLLAIAGISLALSSNSAPASDKALLGDIMALVGSFFWASVALIARTTQFSKVTPELQIFYQVVVSAILLVPFALYLGEGLKEPNIFHWSVLAMQVVFIVCISFITWFWVLSVYPASDMASFSFLAPLFGLIFGWLILGETITWTILAALALVAVGIILVNRKPKPAP